MPLLRALQGCHVCARCGIMRFSHALRNLPYLCVLWAFAVSVRALGVRLFRMCRGLLPRPYLLWDFAAFTCAVGLCRTRACFGVRRLLMCRGPLPHRACFGISPLSRAPWAFATSVPAVGFRRFLMCRGPLPRPYLLWNFATFACTAGLCRGRVHLGHCHVHACVLTLLLQVPRSFDVYVRTAAFMSLTLLQTGCPCPCRRRRGSGHIHGRTPETQPAA